MCKYKSMTCPLRSVNAIFESSQGGEAIEVILIPLMSSSEENTIHLSNEVFRHMKRLRIFVSSSHKNVMYFCSHDPIKFLPNSLYWINWSYYPSPSLPENFEPPKLVGLIMQCSYLVNLGRGQRYDFKSLSPLRIYS